VFISTKENCRFDTLKKQVTGHFDNTGASNRLFATSVFEAEESGRPIEKSMPLPPAFMHWG